MWMESWLMFEMLQQTENYVCFHQLVEADKLSTWAEGFNVKKKTQAKSLTVWTGPFVSPHMTR